MEKAFDPEKFESRLYDWWESSGFFKAEDASSKPAFHISMPPPNVTGALHNGHALFVTIQDALTRWKRMKGCNALWLPGTDHAGIATQMVVERELTKSTGGPGKKGLTRHDLGREQFVKRVWEWKEKHGNIITTQMRKLGGSPDWSRQRFTMDAGLSVAVREAFVRFYEEGLLYRGNRLINWCTSCQTALSDLEVVPKEKKGAFYHLKYISADGKTELIIATTRPETLLGDTAVAVHPQDARYTHLVGKKLLLPLMKREIPVIADEYVDKEFGSGALKVTPGHDFNDYDLGIKHKLPVLSVFDKQGKVNEVGGVYAGLSILDAREKIVQDLTDSGLLVKTEEHTHSAGVCERCERVVEPMISDQWFLNVKEMADNAIKAVRLGDSLSLAEVDKREDAIKIVPESWSLTFYQWMENIRDWCVSRQLWWGHQIPAWYCGDCKKITVTRTDPTECAHCKSQKITQDEDVLDTWFSSGLWPFSTLGWPEKTKSLETFYPSSIMETGFDILFFWVARMIMMGMHFNGGKVPFKRVYLHAMVRDEKGQKMSKTKGNVIDPLEIIRDYGADAFRFTLSVMAGQGRDVKLSLDRVDGYKAFCNKLWNASRYVLMRLGHIQMEGALTFEKVDFEKLTDGKTLEAWVKSKAATLHPINQWILRELEVATARVDEGLEEFKLNESAGALYTFIWNQYCDWYIEFSKVLLDQKEFAKETQICMFLVLERMLKLAHPIIPFVTEEIYQNLPARIGVKKGDSLMQSAFPEKNAFSLSATAAQKAELWKKAIEQLRAFRGENAVPPKARPRVTYESSNSLEEGIAYIRALSQLESLEKETGANQGKDTTAEVFAGEIKFLIPMAGIVDVAAELKRLEKEKKDAHEAIGFVNAKLSKESFISKAPKELIDKETSRLEELKAKLVDIDKAYARIKKLENA